MSIDKCYFMWEIETPTAATSHVRKLSDGHVVGNKEDDIEGLKSILKLKSKNAVKDN